MKPEDLKYNSTHEWLGIDSDGMGVVGITDFALAELTDLVFMALPEVGTQVTQGEQFGEVESVKAVSPLYSPIDGEVVEVHSELADNLETLADDPYVNGWFIKIKIKEDASTEELLDHEAYKKQCSGA